ncbi:hypothetical protein SAMN05216214_10789 [Atopomonas hussainii]|uniref:Uncharacterized protein n=1 Tax=Atopomonas hussainii TaxID=1429083 RepID=A0A1H7LQ12_9GAMM|nr:hypothetical protein SAMN05216214_10789 [Atopomonas hussainii]
MEWRYLIRALMLPPGSLLLLLLLAWWLRVRWPKFATAALLLAVGGLWLMGAPRMVQWQASLLESEPALDWRSDWAEQAQAIVVLGGGRERGDPGWGGMRRVRWPLSGCAMRRDWPNTAVYRF